MLPPQHRLRRAAEIAAVNRQGRRWQHPLVVMLLLARPEGSLGPSRFAFVAGKRVGKAVVRNKAKRRMREIVRHRLGDLEPGVDCLFIARPPASGASYAELESALVTLLRRGGLIAGSPAALDHKKQASV